MVRVLVVEDEVALADEIAEGLSDEGMAVDVANDGAIALEKLALNSYDVIVLDRDLPRVHGDEVCRRLVAQCSPVRVLMLTASGDLEHRVDGLSIGADDYLPKPFAFIELVARLRSLERRPPTPSRPVLARAGIVLDRNRRTTIRDGRFLRLSRKEFGLLEAILEADGDVLSAEALLERVWDENTDPFTNAVRITMARLRRKLGDPPVVETLVGEGYRIADVAR